jgi:hypothetical protein
MIMNALNDFGFWVVTIITTAFVVLVVRAITDKKSHKSESSKSHRRKGKKNEPLIYPGPAGYHYIQYPGQPPSLIADEHAEKAGLIKRKEPEKPHRSAWGVRLS